MKKEHKIIIKALSNYLEKYPNIRFGQALVNLNINRFEDDAFAIRNPYKEPVDIYNDLDEEIVKRIKL